VIEPVRRPAGVATSQIAEAATATAISHQGSHTPRAIQIAAAPNVVIMNTGLGMK
jgi:hypothetical protein